MLGLKPRCGSHRERGPHGSEVNRENHAILKEKREDHEVLEERREDHEVLGNKGEKHAALVE